MQIYKTKDHSKTKGDHAGNNSTTDKYWQTFKIYSQGFNYIRLHELGIETGAEILSPFPGLQLTFLQAASMNYLNDFLSSENWS